VVPVLLLGNTHYTSFEQMLSYVEHFQGCALRPSGA